MDCKFTVGQRVAAIIDVHVSALGVHIDRGTVATVSAIDTGPFLEGLSGRKVTTRVAILLREYDTGPFWWFPADAFKPLDESRLDCFRAHLTTKPADCPLEVA